MSRRWIRRSRPAHGRAARRGASAVAVGLGITALVVPLTAGAASATEGSGARYASLAAAAIESGQPDWQPLPGYPVTVDGLEVSFRTAHAATDPLGLSAEPFAQQVPTLGFQVTNTSDRPRVLGIGADLATAGVIDPLWDAAAWGGPDAPHAQLGATFAVEVAPGATWPAADDFLATGLAQWPGRTVAILELDALPDDGGAAVAELAAVALPGRFVPITADADGTTQTVGVPVTVHGAPAALFPGATATVRAEGLPAGGDLEVWLVPSADAFTIQLQGGALPETAAQVGAGTVSADGVLETAIRVPGEATSTGHTVLVGAAGTRWWPGSGSIPVDAPSVTEAAVADAGTAEHTFTLDDQSVTVVADRTAAGRTTATLSATGPAPVGFTPAGETPGFVHLATTADAAAFTVCIPDDLVAPAPPPEQPDSARGGTADGAGDGTADADSTDDGSGTTDGAGATDDAGGTGTDADSDASVDADSTAPGPDAGDTDTDVGFTDTDADTDSTDASASPAPTPTGPAHLYLHERVGAFDHRWIDLSDAVVASAVDDAVICAQTATLGVFALGHPVDDGSRNPPADGILSHDNDGPLADGDFAITVDLFAGENARTVRLYEDGELIGHRTLALASPEAQQARFEISGRADGTYVYTAELENSRGVSTTAPLTVEVTDAAPATPALSLNGPRGGSFTLTARTLWGTNATSYAFFEDGVQVAEGTLVAATPGPQEARLDVTGRAPGTYAHTVVFRNAAGESQSSPIEVVIP